MSTFIHRKDRPECDNCGAEAPTHLTEWGPPYNVEHEFKKQALCDYCYCTANMESAENRYRAQMMNVLERRLLEALGKDVIR